ncbi:CRISPR-associated endonuclease/helicase Cas3 [Kitasatospora sp. GAS204A]|uniref:CRISPR-associated helicase Cas3' n=1 Tax=unclassified Kitasatospora TaxID=2633591 RepID=UPI0024753B5B|nr:CRISPR-associated helicase Cas3' [Kitasatospora sp. GAS204B]MDH6120956.1 CRISPR-associated endonuclease/helicase Cas3 [Kitasatospora sp. GAS204B]
MTENSESVAASDGLWLDARLWGKSAELPRPYPVVCHLLDTVAVAGALWDQMVSPRSRARIAAELGLSVAEGRQMVCFWAGLHDIGKISPPFQALDKAAFAGVAGDPRYGEGAGRAVAGPALRHETVTHWALAEFFAQCGYPTSRLVDLSASHQIAQLLGGHHGCFGEPLRKKELANPTAYQPGLGEHGWREQRTAHAVAVRRLTGAVAVPQGALSGPTAAVVTGLVVVADWLASQVEVITERLPEPGWRGDSGQLDAHYGAAVASAPVLVRQAGLGRAEFVERSFEERFPFPPNGLQADIAAHLPELVSGAGLLLVTAPTGDGKTEAALHAASVMARASGASGLYFALPTMATADAMFERVRRFAEGNVTGERALTLLHSMAWLSPQYAEPDEAEQGSPVLSDERTGVEAGRWLRTGRRGLLAPLSNGTIDQALTAVLPVRYNVLRLLGLSDKVFVVDEAHAYGPWMHSLLVRLLEWLGALRAPVVLLSATLTGRAASSLVEAYRRGAGFANAATIAPCYPGWLYVDAGTGEVCEPRAVKSNRERCLQVETRQVHWDVREDPAVQPQSGSRREALRELLAPVTEQGGCVLVCCTTVDEAQRTYRDLRHALPELASREGGLRLLHSRYPAHERQRISQECEAAFGKPVDENAASQARVGSILVATQIVEQSLDLDFDLVVSDLAPLAQLLQRAGRGKRHNRANRPAWTGEPRTPRMVVLEPLDKDGAVAAPRSWGAVYDGALLHRTSVLLNKPEYRSIEVPGDVQDLVDAVYADDFSTHLADAAERDRLARMDAERLAAAAAEGQLAKMAAIPAPQDVAGDLSALSTSDPGITEELLTTRLGADTGRAVCVYVQADGSRTLDAAGTTPLPAASGRAPARRDVALVMRHTVPLPGRWLLGRTAEHDVPSSWDKRPLLAELVLLPMRRGADGRWTCRLGAREIEISELGISAN